MQLAASSTSPAQVRSAAIPRAVNAALLQLEAVDALLGAALASFSDLHVDEAFKHKVAAPKPALPPLKSGPGLPPQAVKALGDLLAAEAKAYGLVLAAATGVARARGALRKNHVKR